MDRDFREENALTTTEADLIGKARDLLDAPNPGNVQRAQTILDGVLQDKEGDG